MTFQIALNFEDGVTRFIECRPNEVVADASYRQRINIPLDCRDGACGTCKSFCESRHATTAATTSRTRSPTRRPTRATSSPARWCPSRTSSCASRPPRTSPRPASPPTAARSPAIDRLSDTAIAFGDQAGRTASALGFLPGQYVNIQVPGTDQTRSFSFSSGPGRDEVGFLVRNTTHGVLDHLPARPGPGRRQDRVQRPAGQLLPARDQAAGAVPGRRHRPGAVPVDAAQDRGRAGGSRAPDPPDLRRDQRPGPGQGRRAGGLRRAACRTSPSPAWSRPRSRSYPNKGYVTHHMQPEHLNNGRGRHLPLRPAADGRRGPQVPGRPGHPARRASTTRSSPAAASSARSARSHVKVAESNEAFDARMALELGAAQHGVRPAHRRPARRVPPAGGGDRHAHLRTATSATRRASARPTRRSTCSRSRPPATRRWSTRTASCSSRSTWARC